MQNNEYASEQWGRLYSLRTRFPAGPAGRLRAGLPAPQKPVGFRPHATSARHAIVSWFLQGSRRLRYFSRAFSPDTNIDHYKSPTEIDMPDTEQDRPRFLEDI